MSVENKNLGPNIKVKTTSEVEIDWTKLGYSQELLDKKTGAGITVRKEMNQLTSQFVNAATEEEKSQIAVDAFAKGDGHMQPIIDAAGVANIVRDELKKGGSRIQIPSTTAMQGDTRGLSQRQGLHTPTVAEIIANANKPDPTAPYFDPNSDHMRVINPLEPHYDLSGDFPRPINPLKPGPKMPTNG